MTLCEHLYWFRCEVGVDPSGEMVAGVSCIGTRSGKKDKEYGKVVRLMEEEDTVPADELEQVGREAVEREPTGACDSRRVSCKASIMGALRFQEGCVYRKERLWVPEGKGLWQGILASEHDQGRWTYGPGQDYRVNSLKLLVAENG